VRHTATILLFGALISANAQEPSTTRPAAPRSVGMKVGSIAPAFTLRDQFGREQTNQSLKGPYGTILLFFRSADW
jgi:cytochrome oxidase Cu insertion factor (SCO1/SenC/PrrC family)